MKLEEQLNYKLFIGIDVSKKTIDSAIVNDFGKKIGHKKFANNQFGFDSCLEWLREFYQDGQVVFCLEHTGIYSRLLSMFLQDEGFSVCMESGYVIKHSGGILKGKNDKIVPAIRGKNLYNSAKMPKIYWENNSEHIMTLINLPKETTERIKKQLE